MTAAHTVVIIFSGARGRDRTGDPVFTKDVLYQLSYSGKLFANTRAF